jgi:hypothetical protein
MLNQLKLVETIQADLVVCQRAGSLMNPADKPGKDHATLEYMTLTHHLEWARNAGDNQDVLEQIIQSLAYRSWTKAAKRESKVTQ